MEPNSSTRNTNSPPEQQNLVLIDVTGIPYDINLSLVEQWKEAMERLEARQAAMQHSAIYPLSSANEDNQRKQNSK